MRIDEIMPEAHFGERHSRSVAAPPPQAFDAVLGVRGREVRLLAPFMALRSLPARLRRRATAVDWSRPALEGAVDAGFLLLATDPGREVVMGAIGRFWRPVGNMPVRLAGPAEFLAFEEPGYAKAVLNFYVEPEGEGSRVVTRTLIRGTDAAARRKFGLYWMLIRPGSGLIRRSWLAAIARRAQRP